MINPLQTQKAKALLEFYVETVNRWVQGEIINGAPVKIDREITRKARDLEISHGTAWEWIRKAKASGMIKEI